MNPKQFLQIGGGVLVLVGILGFAGVIGPDANSSIFGANWYFDNAENWAHLVLGIVGIAASFVLPDNLQKILVLLLGVVGILVGMCSVFGSTMLFSANLENPADTVLHLAVGAWAVLSTRKTS